MAEANGNRTHQGPYRPHTGFEDQEHHQAPVTSEIASVFYTIIILHPAPKVNNMSKKGTANKYEFTRIF